MLFGCHVPLLPRRLWWLPIVLSTITGSLVPELRRNTNNTPAGVSSVSPCEFRPRFPTLVWNRVPPAPLNDFAQSWWRGDGRIYATRRHRCYQHYQRTCPIIVSFVRLVSRTVTPASIYFIVFMAIDSTNVDCSISILGKHIFFSYWCFMSCCIKANTIASLFTVTFSNTTMFKISFILIIIFIDTISSATIQSSSIWSPFMHRHHRYYCYCFLH